MTDLNPECLEKAAEALHNEKYPAWLWGTNKELQQHYRGQVTAAVTAYLEHEANAHPTPSERPHPAYE